MVDLHSRLQALQRHLKVKNILSAANLGVKEKKNADSSSLFNSDSHHTIPKAGMIQGEKRLKLLLSAQFWVCGFAAPAENKRRPRRTVHARNYFLTWLESGELPAPPL